jgi:glycine C-acetyltransferase
MINKLKQVLAEKLNNLKKEARLKGKEKIILDILPPANGFGRKIVTKGNQNLINFASNSYLGLSSDQRLIKAEHEAALKFGVGPGAVRFISGTQQPHLLLEKRIAAFFNREAAMIYSSAYAANCGIIAPLVDKNTILISDELNHNSIISAIRLAGVSRDRKSIYAHCNMKELEECIKKAFGNAKRVIIVTDGIFSMRGDYAPLNVIAELADRYGSKFEEGIITIVDDSHGIGAIGNNGRGVVEVCLADGIDIITGTLGKAFGVDGGFVVTDKLLVEYLRETSPFYIYSNPIAAGTASASLKALEILDSDEGLRLLAALRKNSEYFRKGIERIGLKTIEGAHPIVPVVIGDPVKAKKMAIELYGKGILVIALTFPVVPKGQDTIRVQISASHTRKDLDYALESFKEVS